MNRRSMKSGTMFAATAIVGLIAGSAWAGASTSAGLARQFDARTEYNKGFSLQMTAPQAALVANMRNQVQNFSMTWDDTLGVVGSVGSWTSFLTGPSGQAPLATAMNFVNSNLDMLGVTADDVAQSRVADNYTSVGGTQHIYMEQAYKGITVYGAQINANVQQDGSIVNLNNSMLGNIASAVNVERPALNARQAVAIAMASVGMQAAVPAVVKTGNGVSQKTTFAAGDVSSEQMNVELMYLPIRAGDARLVWNIDGMWTTDRNHVYLFNIDAQTGQVWTRFDNTFSTTYHVLARPTESPTTLGNAAFVTLTNPEDRTVSPNGWLGATNDMCGGRTNTTGVPAAATRNPNVNACLDRNADNRGDATAVCTGGNCTATFTPASAATVAGNQRQALVQLFYTNNIVHDIQFKYGFNTASSNFSGTDAVSADAQDGSGTCNANFSTIKQDGSAARMQMFVCNQTNPTRDGDLDLGVIIHEYGHGVSIRQVGGATTCQISGQQQPGEGWSDIMALIYTAKATDLATTLRGEGAYFFGLSTAPNSGATIRRQPYVGTGTRNTETFATLRQFSETHDVGEVWAETLYRVYWSVLTKAGATAGDVKFDVNLANFTPNGAIGTAATAANKRVLFYINEGFKNTRCSTNGAGTTFINTRDGVLAAARANFGGRDMCAVARGFAAMGLGTGAATNGAVGNQATITTSSALPAGCTATN